ncbi:MAG: DUF1801 domain-containing protein [Bacteroidia bacterium]|nr:DUF1801 domain-containing protein [Bacteroidia bacterium]
MNMQKEEIKDVDAYIATFSKPVQETLETLRTVIRKAAPKAEEVISYQMPAYKQDGMLVYFAAYKQHIGFYPTASPIEVFKKDLGAYKTSKGAIQFPLNKPLPKALISKIVKYKVEENKEKAKEKKLKGK